MFGDLAVLAVIAMVIAIFWDGISSTMRDTAAKEARRESDCAAYERRNPSQSPKRRREIELEIHQRKLELEYLEYPRSAECRKRIEYLEHTLAEGQY